TRNGERLLAFHRVEDRRTRVLLRPYSGEAGSALEPDIEPAPYGARHPDLDGSIECGMTPEEVVLAIGDAGVVGVGGSTEPEFVRVESRGVLHCETILQGLPGIAADDLWNAARRVAEHERQELEVCVLVVWREHWMRLGCSLDLLDLDQRLVSHARFSICP